jgi:hypothetical protein
MPKENIFNFVKKQVDGNVVVLDVKINTEAVIKKLLNDVDLDTVDTVDFRMILENEKVSHLFINSLRSKELYKKKSITNNIYNNTITNNTIGNKEVKSNTKDVVLSNAKWLDKKIDEDGFAVINSKNNRSEQPSKLDESKIEDWTANQFYEYMILKFKKTYDNMNYEFWTIRGKKYGVMSKGIIWTNIKRGLLDVFFKNKMTRTDAKEYIDWLFDVKSGTTPFPITLGFILSANVINEYMFMKNKSADKRYSGGKTVSKLKNVKTI